MRKNTRIFAFAAAFTLLVASPVVLGGGYYTWKDDNGVTHFAKTPPTDVSSESRNFGIQRDIHTRYVTPSPSAETPKAAATDAPAQSAPTETAAAPDIYAKDPERCAQAQRNLETLQSNRPIRATAADGSKSLLTPEQRQQQRELAMEVVSIHC